MLRSGQPLNTQWNTVNRQGAQGDFHKGEIIASRDAIENRRARMLLGGGGMQLATPMEYVMTNPYPGQTWVHVGASNTAVTAGTIDPVSGLQVFSLPGWYCSAPGGVPIATVDDAPAYNIPQVPLPDPSNVDNATQNFWVIFIADSQCY
ncbi:MAG TPA: hypothetical protein VK811_03015 [Candidatus Acidoferrum sp.]|jgi:hypothetical protein|nr:hypothetical protein [Candidatus Acidoferrum sp.]